MRVAMPPRIAPLGFLALSAIMAAPLAARAEIEFTGVFLTSRQSSFALADTVSSQTAWVSVGHDFEGYTVKRFDPKSDTLTLEKAGAESQLKLKDVAKIKSARLEIAGTITSGQGETATVTRATLEFGQESAFPLADGGVLRVTPTLRPDGNILYRAAFERVAAGVVVEKIASPSVIARPADPFKIVIGDYSFAFAPK